MDKREISNRIEYIIACVGALAQRYMLYHGSNIAIEKIDLSKSKKGKDFGQGGI